MKHQRSAHNRTPLPPTSRDLEIIRSVARHGLMIRSQIQRLHFRRGAGLSSVQAVCRRLRILSDRGYLRRTRLPVIQGSGPYVYQLGRAASLYLDEDLRKTSGRGVFGRSIASTSVFYHGLEIVDFYTELTQALEDGGGRVISWLGEREIRHRFVWQGKRITLSPDAYCLWAFGQEEGAFFLEWDRGTESMTRLSQKLQAYRGYYELSAYGDQFGDLGLKPRLLIVVPDERRVTRVVRWLSSKLDRGQLASLPTVLVSTRDVVLQDPLQPVWRKPGHDQKVRLVD